MDGLVRDAFEASDPAYLEQTLRMRNPGPGALGSRFETAQTVESLVAADWGIFDHPDVKAPAVAFDAPIPGIMGMVALKELDPLQEVTLLDGHVSEACPQGCGFVEAVVDGVLGKKVGFTTLLLGPDEKDPTRLVVWTFFPGDPVQPSTLPRKGSRPVTKWPHGLSDWVGDVDVDLHGTRTNVHTCVVKRMVWAKVR